MRSIRVILALTCLNLFLGTASQLFGAPPVKDALVVEEDWEIRIDTQNVDKCCPQFSTFFKLDNNRYYLICWNYRDQPDFVAGGIQVQLWENDELISTEDVIQEPLNVVGEVVTWTVAITANGTKDVRFKLNGVKSYTWGAKFDTKGLDGIGVIVPHLNSYSAQDSVEQSEISYGKEHVQWFGITESRTFDDRGRTIVTDSVPRAVYDQDADGF
jgi:hypothetical protein